MELEAFLLAVLTAEAVRKLIWVPAAKSEGVARVVKVASCTTTFSRSKIYTFGSRILLAVPLVF